MLALFHQPVIHSLTDLPGFKVVLQVLRGVLWLLALREVLEGPGVMVVQVILT